MLLNQLKIITANVNSFIDSKKRKETIDYFLSFKPDIVSCCDTRIGGLVSSSTFPNEYEIIQTPAKISDRNYPSRGILIGVKKSLRPEVVEVDREGNFAVLLIHLDGRKLKFISIYGPNKDSPSFFEMIDTKFLVDDDEGLVLVGDFNLAMKQGVDTKNYVGENNIKACRKFKEIVEKRGLVDSAAKLYKNPGHTFYKPNGKTGVIKSSRLDYVFLSADLVTKIRHFELINNKRSDHRSIFISFGTTIKHNKNEWKLNTSLLEDSQTDLKIEKLIEDIS